MTVCYMAMLLQAPQLEPGTHLQNFPRSPKPVLSSLHIPDTRLSYFCILSNSVARTEEKIVWVRLVVRLRLSGIMF